MKVKITTPENMRYYNCANGTIIEVPLEDYVGAVVASEVGETKLQAAKAQAVAVRTFAINRGVLEGKVISDSAAKAQAFRAPRIDGYPICRWAAYETAGEVLTYKNKLISAVFSQSNGGRIHSALEHWGNFIPYLISKQDPYTTTKKNGHGVGLSQDGAIKMAKLGKDYDEILEFYYPGTKITKDFKAVLVYIRDEIKKIIGGL